MKHAAETERMFLKITDDAERVGRKAWHFSRLCSLMARRHS